MEPTIKDQQIAAAYGFPLEGQGDPLSEDDKQEERKQKEMMKKYYRNRYTSFLQALATKKAEEVKELELQKEKEEKRKKKLMEKVLG